MVASENTTLAFAKRHYATSGDFRTSPTTTSSVPVVADSRVRGARLPDEASQFCLETLYFAKELLQRKAGWACTKC